MKLQNKFFTAICCLILLSVTSCLKQPHPLDGYYEFVHTTGRILPQGSNNCSPAWAPMRGMCIEDYEVANQLGLRVLDNGNLKFATQLSFFDDERCVLQGEAEKTKDGWLYQTTTAAKDFANMLLDDTQAQEQFLRTSNCRLQIFLDEDVIVLNADEDATCQSYCSGTRGSFFYSHFKTPLKLESTISDEALACIGTKSNDCK